MNLDPPTLEGEVKRIENEVIDFKTKQPFYDGQFTMTQVVSGAVYDFTFVTNKTFTSYDLFISAFATQPNAIIEPYFAFKLTDGTVLGANKAQYLVNHEISYNDGGPVDTIQINANIFGGVPIGTTIGVKYYFLVSNMDTINLSVTVRP